MFPTVKPTRASKVCKTARNVKKPNIQTIIALLIMMPPHEPIEDSSIRTPIPFAEIYRKPKYVSKRTY